MNDDERTDFGPLLRQARESRGLSLQQVAASTKISARVLEALERNDVSKLPGGIFSRSFVRAYAKEVGLDPETTVGRFVEAFRPELEEQSPAAASQAVDPESFESGRRTAIALLQVVGLSVLVVIAVAAYRNMRPAPVAPPPPVEAPAPAPPAPPVSEAVTPDPDPAPAAGPATPTETTPSVTTPAGTGQPPATMPPAEALPRPAASPAAGAVVPTAQTPLALSVLADEECWLSLSVDGQKVVARNLLPGERVQFRARSTIVLSAGNAGALALTVNGRPGRALGGRGDVVTTTITVDNAKSFIQ